MRIRTGTPPTELDIALAEALGLRKSEFGYRSWDGVNPTTFTQPPNFSTNQNWIPHMRSRANEMGLKLIDSNNPKEVAQDFLDKLRK